jgi:hypothetical protein
MGPEGFEPSTKRIMAQILSGSILSFSKEYFIPTVCVTRAGAGGGTPSERKNEKA